MATLINQQTHEKVILRVNHPFGRNTDNNITVLHDPGVSRNHAVIVWDGESWKIKDNSSNGTHMNGNRLIGGQYYILPDNGLLQFGGPNSETWQVQDLSAPITALIPMNEDDELIPLHDVFLLPIEGYDIMLHLSEDGQWLCEEDGQALPLKSGYKVGANGQYWYFIDGRPTELTATINAPPPPDDIRFLFRANQNEEHVSLTLVIDNTPIDLGERNHHYLLLLLAKERLNHLNQGYPELEQGWIKKELLMQMMGIEEQHINIQIHRFRKQVASQLPAASTLHQVIERRPGELRLTYSDISIEGGFILRSL